VSEFRVYANKGWQMVFPNGWEVSVMFGAGNKCEHEEEYMLFDEQMCSPFKPHVSEDAEVGVFKPDGSACMDFPCSHNYVSPAQVAKIIAWVMAQ